MILKEQNFLLISLLRSQRQSTALWLLIFHGSIQLNITLQNALQQGSTKDFKMDAGTAGTYRVVVNPTAGTVALYSMATVLDGMTIIHLEKTKDVVNPVLWAYDKETLASTGERIHEDRPARKERLKSISKTIDEEYKERR